MTEEMGYRNTQAVWGLARSGKLLKPRGGQVTLNTTALNMLVYMADNSYDWPPTEDLRRKRLPCRCYSRGWDRMATDFGLTITGGEKAGQAFMEDRLEEMMNTRRNTARNRLSQTAKFLQQQGLIKLLVPADIRREWPATWLLLLGDEKENREVEKYARKCLGL